MDVQSPSQQLVGAVLNGRWRLVRLLGEGGMGAVYEAEGTHGEGKRAIKMLHPEFVREEMIHQRFLAEAQATKGLAHPHIAPILDAGRAEDGTPYLVMELLHGVSLGEYLEQRKGVIPQQEAFHIILELLQALAFAHSRRVVHRDLKPDNIFLTHDARGAGVVKVLDFGIAKVMDLAGGMGSKTRTGMLLGTPGYMSPEQIKNAKAVDPRTDLWSVAVIFYEMLAARPPFMADNEYARITAVMVGEATPIEQAAPHLGAWGPFFRRALAKEPAERFQYAEEMAQAIGAVTSGGVQTPPTGQLSAALASTQRAYQQGSAGSPPEIAYGAASAAPPQPGASNRPGAAAGAPAGQPLAVYPQQGPSVALAPPAGANPPVNTHVSGQVLPGAPGNISTAPDIPVMSAPRTMLAGPPWWIVGVIAFVCLGIGFAAGLLVAGL